MSSNNSVDFTFTGFFNTIFQGANKAVQNILSGVSGGSPAYDSNNPNMFYIVYQDPNAVGVHGFIQDSQGLIHSNLVWSASSNNNPQSDAKSLYTSLWTNGTQKVVPGVAALGGNVGCTWVKLDKSYFKQYVSKQSPSSDVVYRGNVSLSTTS
jgi:hypothetical protein